MHCFPHKALASKHTSCYLHCNLFPSPAINQLLYLSSKMKSHVLFSLDSQSCCNPDANKDISGLEGNFKFAKDTKTNAVVINDRSKSGENKLN